MGVTSHSASAQEADQAVAKVADLNEQAMEAYTSLDMAAAAALLLQAVEFAEENRVPAPALARTYLNLAVVAIAGQGDRTEGLNYCLKALEADPSVELDPLTRTPEVEEVFNSARERYGQGADAAPGAEEYVPEAGVFAGPGNIPHVPVPEQLAATAVPVFIEVPDEAEVGPIAVMYRGPSMNDYKRGDMVRVPGGFGYEIPCEVVAVPSVSYYIEAFATSGERLGFAGTPEEPVQVTVVATRTQPAPALPGKQPPEPCAAAAQAATVPSAANPDDYSCQQHTDCYEGEVCAQGMCVPDSRYAKHTHRDEPPKFFLRVLGALGGGYATAGKPADRVPSVLEDIDGNYPYELPGQGKCPSDQREACVRVTGAGFVPTYALRIDSGYFFKPRLAAGLYFRYQFNSGESANGFPAGLLIGARLTGLLTKPAREGFRSEAYIGGGYGQIQLRPDQAGAFEEPYITSGRGSINFGANFGYRFTENFGIIAGPEFSFLFPVFLFNLQGVLGFDFAF